MGVYDDLKEVERRLDERGYSISRYEIRESRNWNQERRNLEHGDKFEVIGGRPAQRATAENPLKALNDWGFIDSDEYVIEVFLSDSMDRVIYDPVEGEMSYVQLSGKKEKLEEMIEE